MCIRTACTSVATLLLLPSNMRPRLPVQCQLLSVTITHPAGSPSMSSTNAQATRTCETRHRGRRPVEEEWVKQVEGLGGHTP